MKVIKEGNVERLNHVKCPYCGAIYNDVKPADIHWVQIGFDAITCLSSYN